MKSANNNIFFIDRMANVLYKPSPEKYMFFKNIIKLYVYS